MEFGGDDEGKDSKQWVEETNVRDFVEEEWIEVMATNIKEM